MGKHQIMSVPKEARGTSDWDMFATWGGQMPTTERGLSEESLRLAGLRSQ